MLFVHRLSPVRRTTMYIPALLDALRNQVRVPWMLAFAGGGPELHGLSQAVARSGVGDHCRLLGNLAAHRLPALYRAADVFVHPTYAEGFPRVILEAMAAGLPVVTTDAGGTAEILGSRQQQFVIPREDSVGFAQAVAALMNDASLQCALAAENREAVRRFDTIAVAEMYDRELFG
jgi:glycosyltransferase involved in cell wall biosynthesis